MSSSKVLLAFSGGLDTTFCLVYLKEQGYEVHTATVDTGGFSSDEIARIQDLSQSLGAHTHTLIDGKKDLFEHYLKFLIFGNVLRGQVYPLSVSAERVCQARCLISLAHKLNVGALAHGSTGSGNDQVRFDVAFRTLYPKATILTPIRDLSLSRQEEVSYLAKRGITVPPKTGVYSINEGMWGTSIGGQETLTSWDFLPENAFPRGSVSREQDAQELLLTFEKGIPTHVNQKKMDPVELIQTLNTLGSALGLGRGTHLGETILGIKGRIGFEAPAAYLLITAHRELEKLVLSGKQLFWKETLGNLYGSLLHEGHFLDPLARDVEAFLSHSQARVTGEVRLKLEPLTFSVLGCRSTFSLMNSQLAKYGESNALWSNMDALGFTRIFGMSQQLHHQAGSHNNQESS
ncbi:MAG: argininosuccinate synthase [Holophagaceae bacterium]|jgi:argininosuccinate synthase